MTRINCTSYRQIGAGVGKCLHQAAPRRVFGPALCIVEMDDLSRRDPRIPRGCALCTPHQRPSPYVPQVGEREGTPETKEPKP